MNLDKIVSVCVSFNLINYLRLKKNLKNLDNLG